MSKGSLCMQDEHSHLLRAFLVDSNRASLTEVRGRDDLFFPFTPANGRFFSLSIERSHSIVNNTGILL